MQTELDRVVCKHDLQEHEPRFERMTSLAIIVPRVTGRVKANIGIDTKIEVIVASPTTWEAHHSPRAKPEGCGELPRSLVTQQWPKWRYQFLFYHDETKSITNKQKNAR